MAGLSQDEDCVRWHDEAAEGSLDSPFQTPSDERRTSGLTPSSLGHKREYLQELVQKEIQSRSNLPESGTDHFERLLQALQTPSPAAGSPLGNLELSDEDIALLDAMVAAAQCPAPLHPRSENHLLKTPSALKGPQKRKTSPVVRPPASKKATVENPPQCEDPFGDFPEELPPTAVKQVPSKPETPSEDPFGDFPGELPQSTVKSAPQQMVKQEATLVVLPSSEPAVQTDDPFGDFPDMIDFDSRPSLNPAPSQPVASKLEVPSTNGAVLPAVEEEDPFGDCPDMSTLAEQPVKKTEEDPFGDDPFGDGVDFEALDQQVSQQAVTPTNVSSNQRNAALQFARYKVLRVSRSDFVMSLAVATWESPEREAGVIQLRGEWFHTALEPGTVVHVCSLLGETMVDVLPLLLDTSNDDDVVLVVHPDLLLTPTTISDSVQCLRRAVLKNQLGSSGFTEQAPLLGTIRHSLFEAAMRDEIFDPNQLRLELDRIVRENAEALVAANTSTRDVHREVGRFIPQILEFANKATGFGPNSRPVASSNQGLHLSQVYAVEEPLVSPELGLKGNADMIVRTRSSRLERQMTVELKTGHSQKSQTAHMAQLVLYIVLMRARYGPTAPGSNIECSNSGILLYMNGEAQRYELLCPTIGEMKSLINQRNRVASEMMHQRNNNGLSLSQSSSDQSAQSARNSTSGRCGDQPELPELIGDSRSCSRCYIRRECMLYARASPRFEDVRQDRHEDLLNQYSSHLSNSEISYFRKWMRLIDYEAHSSSALVSQTWLHQSMDREKSCGKTLSEVVLDVNRSRLVQTLGSTEKALLVFRRSASSSLSTQFDDLDFEAGDHSVVSIDRSSLHYSRNSPMHVARGFLDQVQGSEVTVRVDVDDLERLQRLHAEWEGREITFRIDKDDISTGVGTLRQNLIELMTGDRRDGVSDPTRALLGLLRSIIVGMAPPIFDAAMPILLDSKASRHTSIPGCGFEELQSDFASMNQDQQESIKKAFSTRNYCLVQGMPGTGKTSLISFLVRLLIAHGKRVLVTSYTHSAVDTVLLKLVEKGVHNTSDHRRLPAVARIGQKAACHPAIHQLLVSETAIQVELELNPDVVMPSSESLKHSMRTARVVGITALSLARSPLLAGEHFDFVIVDEAGQISQPAVIGALKAADRFVMVGDHMQLPPLVSSDLALRGGYGVSLFKQLADTHEGSLQRLTLQYRMHQDICDLCNRLVYNGKLKCGSDEVRLGTLSLPEYPRGLRSTPADMTWLERALDPLSPAVFVDTDSFSDDVGNLESKSGGHTGQNVVNHVEARLTKSLAEGLVSCGAQTVDIGVICPYRAQLGLLNECATLKCLKDRGLEMSTIDRYQGRDKKIILVSLVRSNESGRVGRLLQDRRRLNVAFSRAKNKLIVLGSRSTMEKGSDALKDIICSLDEKGRIVNKC